MVFTCSAITPPKVNQFGRNLEQCEPNVGAALADFGHHPRSSDSLRGAIFLKKTKCLQNFQVLQLQTVITPRWLQMPKTHDRMVSLFPFLPFESIQSLSPGLYAAYRKGSYPNFF